MRWLVHGNLPAAPEALRRHDQESRTAAELSLAEDAPPAEVLATARRAQLEILTADPAVAHAPFDPASRFPRTMVLLGVNGDAETDDAVDRLFARYRRLSPGRLYTVTGSRVKVRQLPP